MNLFNILRLPFVTVLPSALILVHHLELMRFLSVASLRLSFGFLQISFETESVEHVIKFTFRRNTLIFSGYTLAKASKR